MFDERVGDLCFILSKFGLDEECDVFMHADDITGGFEAISFKLLSHLAQSYLVKEFQEFSSCWDIMMCHHTEKIHVGKIKSMPMTLLFGR